VGLGELDFKHVQEDTASGDVSLYLADLPAGSRVGAATASVSGTAFHGRLANLQGARVLRSPVIRSGETNVPPSAGERAFIVDFGRSISVLGLQLTVAGTITLVVPWLGADFAAHPAYVAALPPKPKSGGDTVALSGLESMKLLVQISGSVVDETTLATNVVITTGTLPVNVRASLNGRLPFWSHPDSLDKKVTITGMADDLNALMSSATETPVVATLSVETDAPGVLDVHFDPAGDIEVQRSAEARWSAQPSVAVALAALTEQRIAIPFPTDAVTAWELGQLILVARGVFPLWRAYPAQASSEPGTLGLRVDATFSVARRLEVAGDAELHGVALALRAPTAATELHVEVTAGPDAVPGTGKPMATAMLALAPVEGEPSVSWHEVLFDSPVALAADGGAWLVVQAKTGAAGWVAAPEQSPAGARTLGAAEGGRWDRYPVPAPGAMVVAQARILRRPFPDENAPLLELAWGDGGGERAALDLGREGSTVELGRGPSAPLTISAASGYAIELSALAGASGALMLERVTALYTEAET
jgi:hypothetical protein